MPKYGDKLKPEEVKGLAADIRTLKSSPGELHQNGSVSCSEQSRQNVKCARAAARRRPGE